MTFLGSQLESKKRCSQCSHDFETKEFTYLCSQQVYGTFSPHLFLHLTILGSFFWKINWLQFFYVSVFLLMLNCIIPSSKFTVEPLTCSSWFHSHFDNVMMQQDKHITRRKKINNILVVFIRWISPLLKFLCHHLHPTSVKLLMQQKVSARYNNTMLALQYCCYSNQDISTVKLMTILLYKEMTMLSWEMFTNG